MEFYTYIIFSTILNKYYARITHHPDVRLKEHRKGNCHSTSGADDWEIVYIKQFNSRIEAYNHEGHALENETMVHMLKKINFLCQNT